MKWEKSVSESLDLQQKYILLFIVVLGIVSVASNQPFILLPTGFILMWLFGSIVLNQQYGKDLEIENANKTIRVFEGETSELTLKIKNNSFIPYLNGYLTFSTSPKVENEDFVFTMTSNKNTFRIPVFIGGKSEVVIAIPLKAKQRGTVRIQDIQLNFYHLLAFKDVQLRYQENFKQEIIIYPKTEPVGGIANFPYIKLGNQTSRFSPFEDSLKLVGTRDYQWSDPFNRIHWKASAKTQRLQTKLLERNHHISWALVLNIASKSRLGNLYISPNREKYFSQAAYLSQIIIKQGYSLELYINMKGLGVRPYYLEQGEDREHLKKILEFLARIQESDTIMELESFFKWTDKKMKDPNLIAVVGEVDEELSLLLNDWSRKGRKIFSIEDGNGTSFLKEMKNERSLPYVK